VSNGSDAPEDGVKPHLTKAAQVEKAVAAHDVLQVEQNLSSSVHFHDMFNEERRVEGRNLATLSVGELVGTFKVGKNEK
jgi:hypothetical protein